MRCVSYTRSTSCMKGSEIPSDIIARQNKHIREFVKKNGWKLAAKYSDRKKSSDANEAFERMTEDGIDRKFDMVVVDTLDRCGKYISCAEDVLVKTFLPAGIHFAVASDGFCSMGKPDDEIKGYVAGAKQKVIVSSIRALERERQLNGFYTVHDEKYGYLLSEDCRELAVDEEAAAIIREIFQMLADGTSYKAAAQILNGRGVESPFSHLKRVGRKTLTQDDVPWNAGAVKRIASCTAYVGYWNKKIAGEVKTLPIQKIIDEKLFEEAHAQIKARTSTKNNRPVKIGIFQGRIVDADSGKAICQRTFKTGEVAFVGNPQIKEFPKKRDRLIMFGEVQQAVRDAVRKEMGYAENIKSLIRAGSAEYLKQEALEECYRQAEMAFGKMREAEEPRLAAYLRYAGGEVAEADYRAEKESIAGRLLQLDNELKAILSHEKEIEIGYSEKNPWIVCFSRREVPETFSREEVLAWVERIEIRGFSEVKVTLAEAKWKRYFPEGWFVEG